MQWFRRKYTLPSSAFLRVAFLVHSLSSPSISAIREFLEDGMRKFSRII